MSPTPATAATPAWLSEDFVANLNRGYLDYPLVAFHAAQLLPESIILAFRSLPSRERGVLPGAGTILEMARYGLFIANCQADALQAGMVSAFMTPRTPTWARAVEITYRGISVYAGAEGVTLDQAIRTFLHEELGVADIRICDRAAWNSAVKAVATLPREQMDLRGMTVVTASLPFRIVLDHARAIAAVGPIDDEQQRTIDELAHEVLLGNGIQVDTRVPMAREAFNTEMREFVTVADALYGEHNSADMMEDIAERVFGIDPTRAFHLGQVPSISH